MPLKIQKALKMNLTTDEKQTLLFIARTSIERVIAGKPERSLPPLTAKLLKPCGAFVTLKVGANLRGCIGYVEPKKPLHQTVRESAIKAAKDDPRFNPVSSMELNSIQLEVSVLSPLIPLQSPEELNIGTHGIYIIYNGNRGLLLPQVATEMKWTSQEFLENVSLKAGLTKDSWKEPQAKLFMFTTDTVTEFGTFNAVL